MKRLLLIGLDGAMLSFIKKFSEDGKLPCFRRLMEEGSFAEALPAMPTDTPTNWTTIATGAWTGTHGITGFSAHLPGEPLDKSYPTMGTKMCKAEFLWDVAEKADKTCILLYYPISWPPTIKKGIVIDGAGPAGMGEFRLSPETQFATKTSIETRNWYGSSPISVSPSKAKDWTNLPKSFSTPLEMVVSISSGVLISWTAEGPVIVGESESVTKGTYHAVVLDRSKKGYDRVLICREKDASKPVASLNVGEWSDWIFESFEEPKETVKGYFKFKLAELSSNAEKLILHRTEVFKGEGWAYPKQVSEELVKNVGPFIPSIECRARFDSATNFEQARYQADYLVKAAEYLTKNYQWDLFITQVHIQDWLNHRWLSYMCEKSSTYDPEKAKHAWSE
ncbi:MAG: hypothetical protein FJ045_05115, partial [Crenarchaeota archaeon]|nr:hypothetical protein [Thermoproteota archaeon]